MAPRTYDVFVGGLSEETTEDRLRKHCKNNIKVDILNCKRLETLSTHQTCFKLTVKYENKEDLFKEDVWPQYTRVRQFIHKKRSVY